MEVKKDWLSGVLKVLLCFSFVYLWVMALVYVKKSYCGIPGAAVFLIAALLDGILVWCVWKKKKLKSDKTTTIKTENICLLCASLVLLALQFVVIWNAVFRTAWDPGAVWYGAHFVEMGDQDGINSMGYYFSVYPNNLLLVWIYSIVLKLNDVIGTPIANGTMLLALFQCIFVTGAGACLYKTVRHFADQKIAWIAYGFYFILGGLSAWIMIPYSDSTGIIFPVFLFWLYVKLKETESAKKKCVLLFLMFFLCYIGFEIKPMAAIVMIAVAAVEGIHFIGKLLKKQIVWKKSVLACCLSAVLGIGAAAGGVSAVVDSLHFPVVTDTVLGWQHHMMLGLNKDTNGGYSQADFDYSTSFSSAEEQHAAELKEIGKRLKDFGVGGYLQHFVKKSARNYFDGCFGWGGLGETFYTEIFPERGTVLCSLIRSLYYDNTEDTLYRYPALFRQILWCMVLVLVPFSVFTKRPLDKKRQVAVLSVLGLMLYLQIFEAHARYLYTFVPIFVFLATEGIDNLREYLNQKSERRVKK